jgi:hypothetical protein
MCRSAIASVLASCNATEAVAESEPSSPKATGTPLTGMPAPIDPPREMLEVKVANADLYFSVVVCTGTRSSHRPNGRKPVSSYRSASFSMGRSTR